MIRLCEISGDKLHGSREITQRAILYMGQHLREMGREASPDAVKQRIVDLCETMVESQPSMASLFNLANSILSMVEKVENQEDILANALAFLEDERFREAKLLEEVGENLYKVASSGMRILLHSHSSTVNQTLCHAIERGLVFSAVVTEGRPVMEGRLTAAELACSEIPVSIICDAAATIQMSDVDMVLLGADAVTVDGVINKTGSMVLALAAEHNNIPVYILTTSNKFLPAEACPPSIELQDPLEVWQEPPPGVEVINKYYETIPLEKLKFITEEGILGKEDIIERLEKLRFSSLSRSIWHPGMRTTLETEQ